MLEIMTTILAAGTSTLSLAKGATGLAHDIKGLIDKPDIDQAETKKADL